MWKVLIADDEKLICRLVQALVDWTSLDMVVEATAENGLEALYATLKTYLERGGFAIHYNILNADTLRAAQKRPEDYPNLQVRVCGWNMLFSRLPKHQQDEYITRSEHIS